MHAKTLSNNIYAVGAQDYDRRLFDELVSLPEGTSYNSYLVVGSEKTAIIDTVDFHMTHVLMSRLDTLNIKKLDYIVCNHVEQDHSGAIPEVLKRFPEAHILCSTKAKAMLIDHLGIDENKITQVKDGEELSLGDKTLRFIHFPWVHWPETMFTFAKEDKILFTCDLFGTHLAQSELYVTDVPKTLALAKLYYAEIMMPFANFITRGWEKITSLNASMIAPSHGPVFNDPSVIMNAYWSWMTDKPKNLAIVAYISMHGSTKIMVEHLVDKLSEKGVHVEQFNLNDSDTGKLSTTLVDAATIVLASPLVLNGAHPKVFYATYLANALKPKVKFISVIGSMGWGGKMVDQLTAMLSDLKVEVLNPVFNKGLPTPKELEALDQLAEQIRTKHSEL